MSKNLVLESTRPLIENPSHVRIDKSAVETAAQNFAQEELEIPGWEAPVFLENTDNHTIDFLFLGNAINFAYTNFDFWFFISYINTDLKNCALQRERNREEVLFNWRGCKYV